MSGSRADRHSAGVHYARLTSFGLRLKKQCDQDRYPLTPELREHFEKMGEELVIRDVAAHNYAEAAKHFAALDWLKEKREQREALQRRAVNIGAATLIVAILTLIFTLFGLVK